MATRIGLIADTHIPESRSELWPEVFEAFSAVDLIFHGGDVHELDLLDELERLAPVYCARGNGEDGSGGREVQPEDPRVKYSWTLEIESLKVGLTHYISTEQAEGRFSFENSISSYFPDQRPDVVVFGDTHVELIRRINDILVVNPGSPTYPHNYDTTYGTVGFLELHDGTAEASVWQLFDGGYKPFDWDTTPPWARR